jgi:chaperonin GroES
MADDKPHPSPLAPPDDKSRHVKPLGPRVLVRILPGDDRSRGGLFLPPGSKDAVASAAFGEVIEVARAGEDDDEPFGKNVSGIPEGVKVLFPKTEGLPVPWDDALRVLEVKHIFAVVEEIDPDAVH